MNLTYCQAVRRGLAEGAFVLKPILGSANSERVLIYILARGQGYAREIARFFNVDPDSVQKQLVKFEAGGVLITRPAGRTVLYGGQGTSPWGGQMAAFTAALESGAALSPGLDEGIAALQEAGWLDVRPISQLPRIEILGLYPTMEGLAAQLLTLGVLAAAFWYNRRRSAAAAR